MKVQELLANIHNKSFKLESGLEVKKYLPIEVKKAIAQSIVYDCTDDTSGVIKVDSVRRYMSYVRHMINLHTNLEYTDEDYDVICSTEYNGTTLLNAIIECFGDDAKECSRILELVMDDYMQESTLDFTLAKMLHDATGAINKLATKIAQKIEGIDLKSIIPESVDMNTLGDFLNKYIK
jgi:hypothetical protein